jgi:hypothetical protein
MRTRTLPAILVVTLLVFCRGVDAGGEYKSAEVSRDQYRVGVKYEPAVATGQVKTARIYVVAGEGWKVNEKFPWKVEVTAPAGVSVTKAILEKKDAKVMSGAKAVFKVTYEAASAGSHALSAKIKLSVCKGTTQCLFPTETLKWTVSASDE